MRCTLIGHWLDGPAHGPAVDTSVFHTGTWSDAEHTSLLTKFLKHSSTFVPKYTTRAGFGLTSSIAKPSRGRVLQIVNLHEMADVALS